MASTTPYEGLDVTADEVQRIEKALQNEEFRKLFVEYAQEISDPENRRRYEAELTEMERSRGMDVKFLHPKPGYVLKTSIDGDKKAFINICKNENIGKPTSAKCAEQGSGSGKNAGVQWSLPYSLAPGRDDVDHAGKKCVVYDCLFHPECFEQVDKDSRFRTLMESTAMDGIEREFQVQLDRNNIKKPKMKFKGRPQATIMRTPNKEGPVGENSLDALNLQYPYDKESENNKPKNPAKSASKISVNRNAGAGRASSDEKVKSEKKNGFTQPKYSIVHRGHFDMQQCTFARDSMPSTRPQELIVKVELPLLKSAATVQLDVFERNLHLECKKPASYRLDLTLPFPVDEDKGSAKFDKSKACLTITLAVLPPEIPTDPSIPDPSSSKPMVEEIVSNGDPSDDHALRTSTLDAVNEADGDSITGIPDGVETTAADAVEYKAEVERAGKEGEHAPQESSQEDPRPAPVDSDAIDVQMDAQHLAAQEIGATEKGADEATPSLSNHCPEDLSSTTLPIFLDPATPNPTEISPVLPLYDFYQSDDSITLIIRETGICSESLTTVVADGGLVMKAACRRTKDDVDGQKAMYSIVIKCLEGHSLREEVTREVSETNAVLVMKKKDGCGSSWSGFRAGVSMDTLEERLFLTEETLEDVLSRAIEEQPKSKEKEPCRVTRFSVESVRAEFEVTTENINSNDVAASSQDTNPPSEEAPPKPATCVIPSLDLARAADLYDESPSCSDSQSSPPSCSGRPGLKSALRSPRRRAYKSVSFSEEVLVEMFLEGPNRAHQKGGHNNKNNKKKGRRTPFFRPRRTIEKLKDNSWESYSDSELLHRNGASTEEDDEQDQDQDREGSEWSWKPDQVLMRQSSSESESGPEVPSSPRTTKGKKSNKGSRRRRKEKARREASLVAGHGEENSDTNGNEARPKFTVEAVPVAPQEDSQAEAADGGDDIDNESSGREPSGDIGDLANNNNNEKSEDAEDEELPLEMQDHKTKCAFEFSNRVIYDLDD